MFAHVLLMPENLQMRGVDTTLVLTDMVDLQPFRQKPVRQQPNHPVGVLVLPQRAQPHPPVPSRISTSQPLPARTTGADLDIYLAPEPNRQIGCLTPFVAVAGAKPHCSSLEP